MSLEAGRALAQDLPAIAGVSGWAAGEPGGAHSVTIAGDAIYVDGVLQAVTFRPGHDMVVEGGKAVLVRHDADPATFGLADARVPDPTTKNLVDKSIDDALDGALYDKERQDSGKRHGKSR